MNLIQGQAVSYQDKPMNEYFINDLWVEGISCYSSISKKDPLWNGQ